jgi:Domain of unknown function (DUF4157)
MKDNTKRSCRQPGKETSTAAANIVVQPKLAIGAVNDPAEQEADAMADKVMRMQELPSASVTGANSIQRKCADCEEEEKVQRKPLASFIQRKESSAGIVASDVVSNKINASKGGGSSMDSHTQSFMQSRFGADFSNVKIHTGIEAVQMNRELNAKAFTVGSDIYFNEDQYNPGSGEGKHLLAHELTHTIQQDNGTISKQVQKKVVDDDRHVTCRNTRPGATDTLRKAEVDAINLARAAALQIRLQLAFHSSIPLIGETPGLNRFRDILWRRFQLDYNQANVRNTTLPILARRFELVAGWITRLNHRYICGVAGVEPPGDCTTQPNQGIAWTATGINRTQLCEDFWTSPADERAETILHEWTHFGFDWLGDCEARRNLDNTVCYDQFAGELAGTAVPADYDTCCVPPAGPLPALAGVP